MQLHVLFLYSRFTELVRGIKPIGFFPRTLSFTNLSFVDAPDPLTGHSYILDTLRVFVSTRGPTFEQNVLPTIRIVCLQVSVTLCAVVQFTWFHLQ